jgi:hypothetical protein
MRLPAALTACWLLLCASMVAADTVGDAVAKLGSTQSGRIRLSAALELRKERDPRAVIALAGALRNDGDGGVRLVCAISLGNMIDARTAADAVQLAFAALDDAAANDRSADVVAAASNSLRAIAKYRPARKSKTPAKAGPPVFVTIDATLDQSKQMPAGGGQKLQRILETAVKNTGYATQWPGGSLPTGAELASAKSRAFIVASTVKTIQITTQGSQTQIACSVAVRIAPWTGRDGGERWEANRAASASGNAKVMTGSKPRSVSNGITDCIEAVTENVTSSQVVPFLKRIATTN